MYNADFVLSKAKVGLMKDEAAGSIIPEFVALRPKMYSFVVAEHRAKGIQRALADLHGAMS